MAVVISEIVTEVVVDPRDEAGTPAAVATASDEMVDVIVRRWQTLFQREARHAEPTPDAVDDWDVRLDQMQAHATLARLGGHHRSALTLRYLDGLPVREVAACLGRTEGATEVLLVRAKAAFRARYENGMAP